MLSMFYNQKWADLRDFCLNILDESDLSFDPCLENLKIGIMKSREMDIDLFDIQDALAGLYFCYSLGKNIKS